MKGIVLSLPLKEKNSGRRTKKIFACGFRVWFKKYFLLLFLLCFFSLGMVLGSVVSANSDSEFISKLDFLFNTNLDASLSRDMLSSFIAHFASNFIFTAAVFLCGFAPWGCAVIPLVTAFKGFGTGILGGYLIASYGFKGLGFYLVVVLPGAFISSIVLVFLGADALRLSVRLFCGIFDLGTRLADLKAFVLFFLKRSAVMLSFSAAGALVDMLLWTFVSKMFF